jgi:hypothetical protein
LAVGRKTCTLYVREALAWPIPAGERKRLLKGAIMPRHARFVALACLAALVTALPTYGAPPKGEGRPAGLTTAISQALERLWTLVVNPRQVKEGIILDPNGQCGTAPTPACGQVPTGEEGLIADPNGGN